jgi:hypothetical protein
LPSDGAVAQLGERRLCTAEVGGSNPPGSTINKAHKLPKMLTEPLAKRQPIR